MVLSRGFNLFFVIPNSADVWFYLRRRVPSSSMKIEFYEAFNKHRSTPKISLFTSLALSNVENLVVIPNSADVWFYLRRRVPSSSMKIEFYEAFNKHRSTPKISLFTSLALSNVENLKNTTLLDYVYFADSFTDGATEILLF